MTHRDIYTKFMIEYDKANVTSSYPSLTEYEVATVLDKAYNALIAQKVTGNNIRRSSVESDIKSISDLQPLLKHAHPTFRKLDSDGTEVAINVAPFNLPSDFLYFVQLYLTQKVKRSSDTGLSLNEDAVYYPANTDFENSDENNTVSNIATEDVSNAEEEPTAPEPQVEKNPYDLKKYRRVPVRLVSHQIAEKFFTTSYNMPWIKIPVCYIENGIVYVVYDLLNPPQVTPVDTAHFVYIKKPNTFVNNIDDSQFECNDTVAEELISLAVAFALENVESSRLNSKLNMRGLEA